jgi:Mn-dependent DtxR family transcriptional regulator
MLTDILEACKTAPQGLCLEEIAHRLKKDPSVVEGMIDQLLRMGRLVERPAQAICETCPARASCILIERPVRVYSVPMNPLQE